MMTIGDGNGNEKKKTTNVKYCCPPSAPETTMAVGHKKPSRKLFSLCSDVFHRLAPGRSTAPPKKVANFNIKKQKEEKKRWSPFKISSSFLADHIKKKNKKKTKEHACECRDAAEEEIPLLPSTAGNNPDRDDKEDTLGIESVDAEELAWMIMLKKVTMMRLNENSDDDSAISDLGEMIWYDFDEEEIPLLPSTAGKNPDRLHCVSESHDKKVTPGIYAEELAWMIRLKNMTMMRKKEDGDDDSVLSELGEMIWYDFDERTVCGGDDRDNCVAEAVDDDESRNGVQNAIMDDSENKDGKPSVIQSDDREFKIIIDKKMLKQMLRMASMAAMVAGIWFLLRISVM